MVGRNGDGQLLELHQPLRLRLRGRVVGMAIGRPSNCQWISARSKGGMKSCWKGAGGVDKVSKGCGLVVHFETTRVRSGSLGGQHDRQSPRHSGLTISSQASQFGPPTDMCTWMVREGVHINHKSTARLLS